MNAKTGHDKVLVLVKALPHAAKKHGETVCCAGITPNGEWRRLYPIRFRQLKEKFSRWQWLEYDWHKPDQAKDKRWESQHVEEETIIAQTVMPQKKRASFLSPIIFDSILHAQEAGNSLTLIRPLNSKFTWKRKTEAEVEKERLGYEFAANQLSFFDNELKALTPCPYEFKFSFEDGAGPHAHACKDWETSAMFNKFRREYGETDALKKMSEVFNEDYPSRGMAFAMGTHSSPKRAKQWLLIGVIRLDEPKQFGLRV